MTAAQRIIFYLKANDISIDALSEMTEISTKQLNSILNEGKAIRYNEFIKIITALRTEPNTFLKARESGNNLNITGLMKDGDNVDSKNRIDMIEILDTDLRIASCAFSDYDDETQAKLLSNLEVDMCLNDIEMQWDLENGYTILNKDNRIYKYAKELFPIMMTLTDAELQIESKKHKSGIIKNLFDNEKQRRELFCKLEQKNKEMKILRYQIAPVEDSILNYIIFKYNLGKQIIAVFDVYNRGFIQGKRAERERMKASQK